MPKNSCWKCESRHVGYHITCEDYLKYKAECDRLHEIKLREGEAIYISSQRVIERRAKEALWKKRGRKL